MNCRSPRPAKLTDAVALLMIAFLAFAVVVPSLAQVRHLSKSDRCLAQLGSIGTATRIYANDNNEKWMLPGFSKSLVNNGGIDYLAGAAVNAPPTPPDPGEVGYERENESTAGSAVDPDAGSTAVSTTRAFWMLVRSGDLDPETFVCPVSQDKVDPSPVTEWYYDFAAYENISYGYRVPFGPRETRPQEGLDNRVVVAADKGPYYFDTLLPDFEEPNGSPLTAESRPVHWRRFNSPNHHGKGQHALLLDTSVVSGNTPALGIHSDNIYTLMVDQWDETSFNRMHGESPYFATVAEFPYPGERAFGLGDDDFSATDSLIYP